MKHHHQGHREVMSVATVEEIHLPNNSNNSVDPIMASDNSHNEIDPLVLVEAAL
jgi:hypothetical protein